MTVHNIHTAAHSKQRQHVRCVSSWWMRLLGSLPDGLELLVFDQSSLFQQTLQPGVIPASVVLISMNRKYNAELVAGGIPATVRWLRLPDRYAESELSAIVTFHACCVLGLVMRHTIGKNLIHCPFVTIDCRSLEELRGW